MLESALSDPWPQVRRAALVGLNDASRAASALSDDVALVRVAAIELLTALEARAAWPSIEERFTDRDEWPEVITAGLGYVRALCVREAGPALAQVIRRGAREGAWAPDVELAIDALGVAFRLGGEAAEQARRSSRCSRARRAFPAASEAQRIVVSAYAAPSPWSNGLGRWRLGNGDVTR